MLTWHECGNLPLKGLMEPAAIYSQPTVFRGAEDIGVAVAETNVGMVVGFLRVDSLFWLVTIFFGSRETLARHLIACAIMA
jgi:hypothetical protein